MFGAGFTWLNPSVNGTYSRASFLVPGSRDKAAGPADWPGSHICAAASAMALLQPSKWSQHPRLYNDNQSGSWIERPVEALELGRRSIVGQRVWTDGWGRRGERSPIREVRRGLERQGKARRVGDDQGH